MRAQHGNSERLKSKKGQHTAIKLVKGDIITIRSKAQTFATKSRPAIVYQNERFGFTIESITVILLSSTLVDAEPFRITLLPNQENGLQHISQAMVDKITTVHRSDVGAKIGQIDMLSLNKIDDALKLWLSIS